MSKPKRAVRVMIVEDSLVVRQLLSHIVGRDPRFEVAAAVASAEEALAELDRVKPDVISMDIRLPGIDGLEATRRIMSEHPTPIVVIADSVEDASLRISMNALRAGALTVVEKPVGLVSEGYERLAETICTQLYIMSSVPVIRRRSIGATLPRRTAASTVEPATATDFQGMGYLALAASTGGPPALASVLGELPPDFPAPVFVVQHMGAAFMEGFAGWLGTLTKLKVGIGRDGELARPGFVYVAPGDRHMTLGAGGVIRLNDAAPVRSQRPSASVLFSSLARSVAPRTVAVVMTGMGDDGSSGLLDLRNAGAYTLAEHASTTVVNGMPAAAIALGAAREVLPLDALGRRVVDLAKQGAEP